ncbi:MAG TPA: HAD hydrolase family protein [Chitinophagaceae bacterium]|nr:HAD hydrolase family protein [Chitinophagaceae bacterium]
MAENILSEFKLIKTFVFDMDGVLTDGSLMILNDTEWFRTMDIKDGYAMHVASNHGYRMIVISGSTSTPAKKRLQHLGVNDIFMGVPDKKDLLQKYIAEHDLNPEEVLYMGDDIPDYGCMGIVGLSCCPADACSDLKQIVKYISPFNGGHGCARDVIEKVLKLHGNWELE